MGRDGDRGRPGPEPGNTAEISGFFTYDHSPVVPDPGVYAEGAPPDWLQGATTAVLRDLQGPQPVSVIVIVATRLTELEMNGLSLRIAESAGLRGPLVQLDDDLDFEPDESLEFGGGNFIPRAMSGPRLLVAVANILQRGPRRDCAGVGAVSSAVPASLTSRNSCPA
jgi:hypothetical protein